MPKVKDRTKRIIAIYFLAIICLIALFSLSFIFGGIFTQHNNDKQSAVFILDEKALEQTYKYGVVNLDMSEIKTHSEFVDEILKDVAKREVLFLFLLCAVIGIVTVFLYLFLKKQNKKRLEELASEIRAIKEPFFDDSDLSKFYNELEKHVEENLKSFKRLSSYLSHEQKNAISLLRAKLQYHGHEEYLKQLDDISTSIDDVLTLSDSGNIERFEETDCTLICAELCDAYKKLNNSINFTFNEADCSILAKPRWIVRAVGNLLDNAVKYGKGLPIDMSVSRQYDSVVITVTDYGCGIPKNAQNKIFQNRYRVKDLNKAGYGIGLSLVSHVCDLCGGFVWVDSEQDNGSVFYLSFPAFERL